VIIQLFSELNEEDMPMVYVIHHYTGATAKRKADLILGIGV